MTTPTKTEPNAAEAYAAKQTTKKVAPKKPRMSASAARAEGVQRTKAALAAKTAAAPDGPVVLPEEAAKREDGTFSVARPVAAPDDFTVVYPAAHAGGDVGASDAGAAGAATQAAATPDATRGDVARHGAKRGKPAKGAKAKADKAGGAAKHPSGLDLAAKVLADAGEPLSAKAIAERAIAAGWKTSGKTPEATLYAAMTREIATKGAATRFLKVGPGRFAPSGKGA